MSSILRIASSRANGARSRGPVTPEGKRIAAANSLHSTGPVTPEGKAIASQNAIRHGLLADSIVMEGESEDRFSAMLSCLQQELQPESGVEEMQVEIMAVAHWRRMRLWSLEKAQYIDETRKRRAATGGAADGDTPVMDLARSFRSLADQSHALELLNRYEVRFSREYLRALNCYTNHSARKAFRRAEQARQNMKISKRTEPKIG